jgi:hypothetical protein
VTNATASAANPVPANATSMTVRLTAPGQASVSYAAMCGDLQSGQSAAASITVSAPTAVVSPTPTPTAG